VHSLYGGKNPDALVREIQENYQNFLSRLP